MSIETCPDCGKTFKNVQTLGDHCRWAHKGRTATSAAKVTAKRLPVAQHRRIAVPTASTPPRMTIRVEDREFTPEEFNKFVGEMEMVRAALARVR